MTKLRELLEIGDLDGLVAIIDELEKNEPGTYRVFTERIKTMVKEFQLLELEEFFNKQL